MQNNTLACANLTVLNFNSRELIKSPRKAGAQYDPLDLIRFIEKNFAPLNSMLELAGMSVMNIYHRPGDIFHDLPLPCHRKI